MMSALKWTGTVSGIMGCLLIASNLPESGWAFVLFLTSSITWGIAGLVMRDRALWSLNIVYVAIDSLGIYRWLF